MSQPTKRSPQGGAGGHQGKPSGAQGQQEGDQGQPGQPKQQPRDGHHGGQSGQSGDQSSGGASQSGGGRTGSPFSPCYWAGLCLPSVAASQTPTAQSLSTSALPGIPSTDTQSATSTTFIFPTPTSKHRHSPSSADSVRESSTTPLITFPSPTPSASVGSDTIAASVSPSASPISSANGGSSRSALQVHHPSGGVVAGIVIACLAVLALSAGLLFWLNKRRQRSRYKAPSHEFRGQAPPAAFLARSESLEPMTQHQQQQPLSLDMNTPPPPFSQGPFRDPLYEKIDRSRAAMQQLA